MKRWERAIWCVALALLLCAPVLAAAADAPVVVGITQDNDSVRVYLAGETQGNLTAQISGWDCEILEQGTLAETGSPSSVLFLIDVSSSMQPSSQTQACELLDAMIERKRAGDQYAIASFGAAHQMLCDFTNERYDLAKSLQSLAWEDSHSNVYQAVEQSMRQVATMQQEGRFVQLVVLTAVVEGAPDGITREELFWSLKNAPLPVHTIGFVRKDNDDSLQALSSLSRIAGARHVQMKGDDDVTQGASMLEDYTASVYQIQVKLPKQAKDGAVRPLELFSSGGAPILRHDLYMPREEVVLPPPTAASTVPPSPESEQPPALEAKPASESQRGNEVWIVLCIVLGLLIAAAAAILLVKRTRRNDSVQEAPEAQTEADNATTVMMDKAGQHTHLLIQGGGPSEKEQTELRLVLNDLVQPHRRYEMTVDGTIEIGREPTQPGITIEDDKSVSRRQCMIIRRGSDLWIENTSTSNKTSVNDEVLTQPLQLKDNDVITCGRTRFSVKIETH